MIAGEAVTQAIFGGPGAADRPGRGEEAVDDGSVGTGSHVRRSKQAWHPGEQKKPQGPPGSWPAFWASKRVGALASRANHET